MNVLILGSGGREHAMGWKIAQSPKLDQLFFAPGNAGTLELGKNIDINPEDFTAVKSLVLESEINLVVVGPEAPLVKGIVNFFKEEPELTHVKIIGPSAHASKLEGSKDFAKIFMEKHQVPTAKYLSVNSENLQEGFNFLDQLKAPYVLKADGLAGGKGVLILNKLKEAKDELSQMLDGKFGSASETVVIEEYLDGIECSVFVLTDGKSYLTLPEAKDYKRIGEGDTGLNTGGMGAISPVPFADDAFMQKVEERIIKPTIEGFQKDQMDYIGFVFIGLMNVEGEPFVIEYNVRMGDPETEVVIPRIKSDFLDLLEAAFDGELKDKEIEIDSRYATTVMLVSGGYPEHFEKGKTIENLKLCKDSMIFHAGTKQEEGSVKTAGGRVIAISSLAHEMQEALNKSFANAELISFQDKYYRKDIGFDLL
jgi:phosphoribosylamine--glycine ligase